MPIDGSMYLKREHIGDAIGSGMNLREMFDKKKRTEVEQGRQDAEYQRVQGERKSMGSAIKYDDQGNATLDAASMKELNQYNPEKALQMSNEFKDRNQAQDKALREKKLQEFNMIANAASGVKDQASYSSTIEGLKRAGVDVSQMPPEYDPNLVKQYGAMALSAKEKIAQQNSEREFSAGRSDKKRDYEYKDAQLDLQREELGVKRKGEEAKLRTGENLPIDKKQTVTTLATKNANISAIKNEIDTFVSSWKNWSPDQRLKQGQGLLKTLNSTQGADAIGTDEAKRLGSQLEFAMGNFTNGNPTQFGRDLDGFFEGVKNKSATLKGTLQKNSQVIDQAMGRAPQPAAVGEYVKMIDPKGVPRRVHKSQVNAALQSGGSLADGGGESVAGTGASGGY